VLPIETGHAEGVGEANARLIASALLSSLIREGRECTRRVRKTQLAVIKIKKQRARREAHRVASRSYHRAESTTAVCRVGVWFSLMSFRFFFHEGGPSRSRRATQAAQGPSQTHLTAYTRPQERTDTDGPTGGNTGTSHTTDTEHEIGEAHIPHQKLHKDQRRKGGVIGPKTASVPALCPLSAPREPRCGVCGKC
jgi:hypothetical protein